MIAEKTTKLVILFEGRTGSTHLMALMNQHPLCSISGEKLDGVRKSSWEAQKKWIDQCLNGQVSAGPFSESGKRHKIIKKDFLNTKDSRERVYGFKTKLRAVCDLNAFASLLIEQNAKIVRMIRRNMVKQTISALRGRILRKQTGTFYLKSDGGENPLGKETLPVDEFQKLLHRYGDLENRLDTFLVGLPLAKLVLSYEDLTADEQKELDRLAEFCEIPPWIPEHRTKKITPDNLQDAIENFEELKASCKGTGYYDMFDSDPSGT